MRSWSEPKHYSRAKKAGIVQLPSEFETEVNSTSLAPVPALGFSRAMPECLKSTVPCTWSIFTSLKWNRLQIFSRKDFHLQFLNCCHDSVISMMTWLTLYEATWSTGHLRTCKDAPWSEGKLDITLGQTKEILVFSNSDPDILCFLSSESSSVSCSHHHARQCTPDAKTTVWWAYGMASKPAPAVLQYLPIVTI